MRIRPDKEFGMRECPSCATPVEANQNRCPICGYDFPQRSRASRGLRLAAALLMLALLLAWLL